MADHRDRVDLSELSGCFDGVIPPVIATCARSGEPNITHLSQLHVIDGDHLAVSNQFFAKTAANLAENPRAGVLVTDSQTYDTFHLDLVFLRTETSGPVFEEFRAEIEAIGALMNMEDVFTLRGADIYHVAEIRRMTS